GGLHRAAGTVAEEGTADDGAKRRHGDGEDRLDPDRTIGQEERQQARRERADGEEDREEGRARELEHEERQRGDEPDRVDRHRSESMPFASRRTHARLTMARWHEGP